MFYLLLNNCHFLLADAERIFLSPIDSVVSLHHIDIGGLIVTRFYIVLKWLCNCLDAFHQIQMRYTQDM